MSILAASKTVYRGPATALVDQETALSWLGKVGERDRDELARVGQIAIAAQQYASKQTGLDVAIIPVTDYYRGWTEAFGLSGEVYGDVVVKYWDMADQQMTLDSGEYVVDRTYGDGLLLSFGQRMSIAVSTRYTNPIGVEYNSGPVLNGNDNAIIMECLRGLMVGLDERSADVILEGQYPGIDELLESINPAPIF